jgi:hypothetical protein
MNWYRVMMPHDSFGARDVGRTVLLEGGAREASLELQGYLRLVGIESPAPVVKKKVRRGKSVEAGPPEVEPVGEVPGDAARGEDGAAD